MNTRPESQGANQILQATGEANMPPTSSFPRELQSENAPAGTSEEQPVRLKSILQGLIDQDAVAERVRLVTGWLKFVRQEKVAQVVEAGWERVKSGKVIEPLNNARISDRPEVSASELMLWRQILKTTEPVTDVGASQYEKNLELLALVLTVAVNPDDVMQADNLLVASEQVAIEETGY